MRKRVVAAKHVVRRTAHMSEEAQATHEVSMYVRTIAKCEIACLPRSPVRVELYCHPHWACVDGGGQHLKKHCHEG